MHMKHTFMRFDLLGVMLRFVANKTYNSMKSLFGTLFSVILIFFFIVEFKW